MKTTAALILALVVYASATHAAPAQDAPRIHLAWDLALDAEGRIETMQLQGKWPGELRERLEQDIRTWQFTPGRIGNRYAPTTTSLNVALQVRPAAAGAWNVHIDSATTGGRIRREAQATYPERAYVASRQGLVILRIVYDESGKVTRSDLADFSPLRSGSLVGAARAAAKRFEIEPERVDGRPLGATAYLPICFVASRRDNPCTWTRPGSDEKLDERSAFSFESVASLKTDVTGRVL